MPGRIADLPVGYRTVSPTMDEVTRATEFFNLVEISEWGMPDFDESEVEEEWADLDLPKSVVLVEDEEGQLVASMTIVNGDGLTWNAFGYVHPGHQERGLGNWIIDWAEATAGDRTEETREGYRIEMLNFTSTINIAAQKLLAVKGYDVVKVFRRMSIDLSERPAPVIWPEGFELRPFVVGRDDQLYFDALQTAFAEHWSFAPRTYENWRNSWFKGDYDTNLLIQLLHDDRVIGICSGKPMGESGWIQHVGVIPEYRRRGLAKLMLQEDFSRFWDKGIRTISLGVDSENRQSATQLYLSMGMHESHSYETNRKILREGLDWRNEE